LDFRQFYMKGRKTRSGGLHLPSFEVSARRLQQEARSIRARVIPLSYKTSFFRLGVKYLSTCRSLYVESKTHGGGPHLHSVHKLKMAAGCPFDLGSGPMMLSSGFFFSSYQQIGLNLWEFKYMQNKSRSSGLHLHFIGDFVSRIYCSRKPVRFRLGSWSFT
jgi:hypothetical protein